MSKKKLFLIIPALIILLSGSVAYCIFTDPEEPFPFSNKAYYSVEYDNASGFTIKKISQARLITGLKGSIIADIIQAGNFIKTALIGDRVVSGHVVYDEIYSELVPRFFNPTYIIYLTTGEPHARSYYLRNFAFFYSGMLDPKTMINREDLINRIKITLASVDFMLDLFGDHDFTTTVVPAGGRFFAAVNYNGEPSDSILGMLSAIESLVFTEGKSGKDEYDAIREEGIKAGGAVLEDHKSRLKTKIIRSLGRLESMEINGEKFLVPDKRPMSAATDVRYEPLRFIVSANYYTMLKKAIRLGVILEEDFRRYTGKDLCEYKESILMLFGREGYIRNSLSDDRYRPGDPARNIVIDFAGVGNGFWDLDNSNELELFKRTSDIILSDPRFYGNGGKGIMLSVDDPPVRFIHMFTAPDYQGRVIWPFYNAQFARGLIALYKKTGNPFYLEKAGSILGFIKESIIHAGGYPEVIDKTGKRYRTYIYKSALANTWFPCFDGILGGYNNHSSRTSYHEGR